MSKVKQCENCKYWDRDDYKFGNHGLCTKAIMWDRGEQSIYADAPMVTMDGSCYRADLYTRFDHWCSQFKENEQ